MDRHLKQAGSLAPRSGSRRAGILGAAWAAAAAFVALTCGLPDDGSRSGRALSEGDAGEAVPSDCGLPVDDFIAEVEAAFPGAAEEDFALGGVPARPFGSWTR